MFDADVRAERLVASNILVASIVVKAWVDSPTQLIHENHHKLCINFSS